MCFFFILSFSYFFTCNSIIRVILLWINSQYFILPLPGGASLKGCLHILHSSGEFHARWYQVERRRHFLAARALTAVDPAEVAHFLVALRAMQASLRVVQDVAHPGDRLHEQYVATNSQQLLVDRIAFAIFGVVGWAQWSFAYFRSNLFEKPWRLLRNRSSIIVVAFLWCCWHSACAKWFAIV